MDDADEVDDCEEVEKGEEVPGDDAADGGEVGSDEEAAEWELAEEGEEEDDMTAERLGREDEGERGEVEVGLVAAAEGTEVELDGGRGVMEVAEVGSGVDVGNTEDDGSGEGVDEGGEEESCVRVGEEEELPCTAALQAHSPSSSASSAQRVSLESEAMGRREREGSESSRRS